MGSRGGEDSRQGGSWWTGWGGSWEAGGPAFACGWIRRNNWGARQTMQPRVPVWGNKTSTPLTEKTCGGWGSRRNSQPHRRVHWRDPQGPRMYTSPHSWESAPEGSNLLVGSRGSDLKPVRAEQVALFPLWPLLHIQCHNTAKWAVPPWWIPKAPPLIK